MRQIPLEFIERFGALTWPEVMIGLTEDWLSSQSAVDMAIQKLEAGSNDPDEIELAALATSELGAARELVSRLATAQDDHGKSTPTITWLRLLIAWLYENRSMFSDPFGVIENLYADFGYPDEIRHLVRYNESSRAIESKEAARKQMEDDWAAYVQGLSLH